MINRIIWILRSFVVTCLVAGAAPGVAFAGEAKLVIVVAKGSAVTNISRGDLKHCFLGDQVSASGKLLVPFNAAVGSPERSGFDKVVLGMTPDEVGRFWVDRKVRGQGVAPRSLPSAAHIVKVTAKFPGAISYLRVDQLTPELQTVTVDGVAYSDPKYNIAAQ
jgi:hypothetical protein